MSGCPWSVFRRIAISFCAFCKLGLSIAIIVIVATKLDGQGVVAEYINLGSVQNIPVVPSCLMATEDYVAEICDYAYGVTAISMATSLVLTILLCFTWDMCGRGGGLVEFIIGACLTLWWTCAGIVFSTAARWANDRNWPHESYRNSIPIMSWAAVLLAGIKTLVYAIDVIRCCKKCCCDDDSSQQGKEKDVEKDVGKGSDKQRSTPTDKQQEHQQAAPQPGAPPTQQMGKDHAVEANVV